MKAMRQRLDQELVRRQLAATRSQAENLIKLGQVKVNGQISNKPAQLVLAADKIELTSDEQYVSRAGLKLASVADKFHLDFRGKTILDVGSSTGGFTDFALQHGAAKVIAVDVGSNQLHPKLRQDVRVELYEQTDIRDFKIDTGWPDIVVIDVSFISLRQVLPAVKKLVKSNTQVLAMVKPQFEQSDDRLKNKGVIKNDSIRRQILKDFDIWVQKQFKVVDKADSAVAGTKGNQERFYLLVAGRW
jgi:23S rRNA (cytidine1920-2'-O)/16S rRNA (cytidine1409-2'-O)-methyltransferase